jgi:hydrogenase maturation factor
LALPPWEAVIAQAPAAMVVTAEPDTAHTAGVFEANDTGSRELADADRVTGSPAFVPGSGAKVIVCGFFPAAFTWNDCATSGAAP